MAVRKKSEAINKQARCIEVMERLRSIYPKARCTLNYKNPLELLVATILAAQCTDERVNQVTPALFQKYKTPEDYVAVDVTELEEDIRSCGFYRNKARCIQRACKAILERFGGQVPGDMDSLVSLDGVGRKTANVLLNECFGVPGIIVDTHCARLARRLGFTKEEDPVKIEEDLMKLWPREHWGTYSHTLVFHGRSVCLARSPKCQECVVEDMCPFPDKPSQTRKNPKTK